MFNPPNKEAAAAEVATLQGLIPQVSERNVFGQPLQAAIRAQIRTIQEDLSFTQIWAAYSSDFVTLAAENTRRWLDGHSETPPHEQWEQWKTPPKAPAEPMTPERVAKLFQHHYQVNYGQFFRISPRRSNRPDLHALMLLDSLLPGSTGSPAKMIVAANDETVWLTYTLEALAEVLTEELIIELLRCGVVAVEKEKCLAIYL